MTTKVNPQRRDESASGAKGNNKQGNNSATPAQQQAGSDGGTYRPRTKDGYQVMGVEPDGTPCSQCGKHEGTVYLIRNQLRGVRSEPLHEDLRAFVVSAASSARGAAELCQHL